MGSIRMRTEVPGPASRDLAARATGAIARPVGPAEIFIARGEGAVVEDVDGNRYIDLTGGLGCLVVGHAHPRVVEAIQGQAAAFLHTDFSVLSYESYVALAERLSERCGGGRRVALFNSGAEAVENAVKIARFRTGRPGILAFAGAFHGRTNLTLSLTHREVPYRRGFGPFSPDVHRVPYPRFEGATLDDFEAAARATFAGASIGAVVVEPVLGEGGFVVPPPAFLPRVAELCRDMGALLIVDEIQAGYGRTGAFLASEHAGVRADLLCLAKSIAAGLPLSAVVGDAELMNLPPHTLGGTYVGNPVACAAALAVLDVIEEEGLIERAVIVGKRLTEGWNELARRAAGIREVRGLGAMVGVEFENGGHLGGVLAEAASRGVLAVSAGREGNVLRHLVPLVVSDEELDEVFEVFEAVLGAAD